MSAAASTGPVVDGFVLAGGRGSRMGFDKARAPWHGQPLALVTAGQLAQVCARVALVRRGPPDGLPWPLPDGTQAEVVREAGPVEPPHPLRGVAAALAAARTPVALIAPCDVPRVPADVLLELLRAAPAVAAAEGRVHPLVAAFPAAWAARAATLAAEGASARAFAAPAAAVEVPAAVLVDVNDRSRLPVASPVRALLESLPFLSDAARARVAAGERARLAQAGILDPGGPSP